MKQFINKYKWWALILLVLPGCQRDDGAPFEEPVSESRMVVSAEDIPELKATLLKKMQSGDNAKLFSANMGAENNLAIDWQRVMQLIDSTGQKTYTFAIADEDDDPFSFYNLVMKYSALGDAHEPFLMKYTMSEGFIPEYLSTGSLENFQGTVKKIRISRNSGTKSSYNSKAPADSRGVASGEDDSCPGTTVGSGSNNGGGDTPPDANNPPDSGGVSCETYIVTNTWYSQACGGGTCEEPIVTGRNSSVVTICNREGDKGEAAGGGENDCDPDEGEIPIATEPLSEVNPDQTQFTKLDYSKATKSEKIAALLSYIRYARKNNKPVKLDEVFTNMPTYGAHGAIYDLISGSVKFGSRVVPITLMEVPLPGSEVTSFKNYWNGSPTEVQNEFGTCFNFEFRVNCTNCRYGQGAFLIQVLSKDLEFMENFLGGE